jgi:hypothetical protein
MAVRGVTSATAIIEIFLGFSIGIGHTVADPSGTGELHAACHRWGGVAGCVKKLLEETIKCCSSYQGIRAFYL